MDATEQNTDAIVKGNFTEEYSTPSTYSKTSLLSIINRLTRVCRLKIMKNISKYNFSGRDLQTGPGIRRSSFF